MEFKDIWIYNRHSVNILTIFVGYIYIYETVQKNQETLMEQWTKDRKRQFTKGKITSKQANRKILTSQPKYRT